MLNKIEMQLLEEFEKNIKGMCNEEIIALSEYLLEGKKEEFIMAMSLYNTRKQLGISFDEMVSAFS